MAEHGFVGLGLPRQYGGIGLPLLDTLLLIKTIQSIDSTAGGLAHRTSTGAVGAVLALGSEEQKEKFIRGVASGKSAVCIGISEPEAGSAATALKTRARIDGGQVVINGQKIFISFADHADYTLVYCRFGDTGR